MPFFQNPFPEEFRGNFYTGERQFTMVFQVPGHSTRGINHISAGVAPNPTYDLSVNDADGNDTAEFIINFVRVRGNDTKKWASITITITADDYSAVTPTEIIDSLNNDSTFSTFFTASLETFNKSSGNNRVVIKTKFDDTRFFVHNGRMESVLRFNLNAGIAEAPTYFRRHRIATFDTTDPVLTTDRFDFDDGNAILVELDPDNSNVDAANINAVGLDSSTVQEDWQLLEGRSPYHVFKKQTVDGSNRITEIIEYKAGSGVGDMAKKTTFSYTGAKTNPDEITEIPYVLTSGDLITP